MEGEFVKREQAVVADDSEELASFIRRERFESAGARRTGADVAGDARAFRAMLTQHVYGLAGRARISGQERLGPRGTKLAATRLGFIALGATLP